MNPTVIFPTSPVVAFFKYIFPRSLKSETLIERILSNGYILRIYKQWSIGANPTFHFIVEIRSTILHRTEKENKYQFQCWKIRDGLEGALSHILLHENDPS